jgi:MFS superfamily sulfate permease-like transporter
MMGLANIITGILYRIPVPIEPMKVLAVVAISQHWSPSMVYASGFSMGIVWLLFSITGFINLIARITPQSVTRGIQAALGVLLAVTACKMLATGWLLGIIAVVIILVFRDNRYAPSAVLLVLIGLGIMFFKGQLQSIAPPALSLPTVTGFNLKEVWQTFLLAGFAQIPLTATNAVIATASLIKTYWPEKQVSEHKLALNMGIMNLLLPLFGGMPLCHGAGGLAGQYYFGARTGGANILEGLMEICLGLFLALSIADLFFLFPVSIIGAMMLLVGIELTRFTRDIGINKDLIPLGATLIVSLLANMAVGFLAGLIVHYAIRFFQKEQSDRSV